MSEELIVRHCAPTLAGMKTGNMFVCSYGSADEMRRAVRQRNRQFAKKGLRVLPLRYRKNKALIYIYRPSHLRKDLRSESAKRILSKLGYSAETSEGCIVQLIKRMCANEEFPHEIGLFLGYPPEDVRGFIENGAENCKCVGCWKVYGNVEAAKKTFAKYKKCTDVYSRQQANGKSVERLTVAG